jgi:hypothetical protein
MRDLHTHAASQQVFLQRAAEFDQASRTASEHIVTRALGRRPTPADAVAIAEHAHKKFGLPKEQIVQLIGNPQLVALMTESYLQDQRRQQLPKVSRRRNKSQAKQYGGGLNDQLRKALDKAERQQRGIR